MIRLLYLASNVCLWASNRIFAVARGMEHARDTFAIHESLSKEEVA